jgi:hypothetical protein
MKGLTVDEVTLHADRVRLWNEFNAAWKGIFTAQKDMLESGQRIQPPQTLMTQEFITKMGNNLTRLCDVVEKYGLVDYQYGVAEEEIMDSKSAKSTSLYLVSAAPANQWIRSSPELSPNSRIHRRNRRRIIERTPRSWPSTALNRLHVVISSFRKVFPHIPPPCKAYLYCCELF